MLARLAFFSLATSALVLGIGEEALVPALAKTSLPMSSPALSSASPAPAAPGASPPSALSSPPAGSVPSSEVVLVPRDTIVVVETSQGYNSYSARTGAKVRYEVLQDVVVNGHVIAKAGDAAQGAVQEGQAGESGGAYGFGWKAANLRLSVDEIYNFCGDTIHVDFDRSEYRRRQGMFGSNKDVQVTKGQKYAAVTDRVQRVCGEPTSEAPLPVPSDALRTSVR